MTYLREKRSGQHQKKMMKVLLLLLMTILPIGAALVCHPISICCDMCPLCTGYDCGGCTCIDARGQRVETTFTISLQTHEVRGPANVDITLVPAESPWEDFDVRCSGRVFLAGNPPIPCGKLKMKFSWIFKNNIHPPISWSCCMYNTCKVKVSNKDIGPTWFNYSVYTFCTYCTPNAIKRRGVVILGVHPVCTLSSLCFEVGAGVVESDPIWRQDGKTECANFLFSFRFDVNILFTFTSPIELIATYVSISWFEKQKTDSSYFIHTCSLITLRGGLYI